MKIKGFLFFIVWTINSCNPQSNENKDIILINISDLNREGIASIISIVNESNPKVIALDVSFPDEKTEREDFKLRKTLWDSKNLVMCSHINSYSGGNVFVSSKSLIQFSPLHSKSGFNDAILEDTNPPIQKMFKVQAIESSMDHVEYHFSIQTSMIFDSMRTMSFIRKNPEMMSIDFSNGNRKFKTFQAEAILSVGLPKSEIEGRIIMIGFLGPGDEDKFYTPLNRELNKPDMYGLEILANIVAQILESK